MFFYKSHNEDDLSLSLSLSLSLAFLFSFAVKIKPAGGSCSRLDGSVHSSRPIYIFSFPPLPFFQTLARDLFFSLIFFSKVYFYFDSNWNDHRSVVRLLGQFTHYHTFDPVVLTYSPSLVRSPSLSLSLPFFLPSLFLSTPFSHWAVYDLCHRICVTLIQNHFASKWRRFPSLHFYKPFFLLYFFCVTLNCLLILFTLFSPILSFIALSSSFSSLVQYFIITSNHSTSS